MEHLSKRRRLTFEELKEESIAHDNLQDVCSFDIAVDDKEKFMMLIPLHNNIIDRNSSVLTEVMGHGCKIYSCDGCRLSDYGLLFGVSKPLICLRLEADVLRTLKRIASRVTVGLTSDNLHLPVGVRDIVMGYLDDSDEVMSRNKAWTEYTKPYILGHLILADTGMRVIGVDERRRCEAHSNPILLFGKEVCFPISVLWNVFHYVTSHAHEFPQIADDISFNSSYGWLVCKRPLQYMIGRHTVFALTDLRQSSDPWLSCLFEQLCSLPTFIELCAAHDINIR